MACAWTGRSLVARMAIQAEGQAISALVDAG